MGYMRYQIQDVVVVPVGKITITGLTGTPPYTYNWNTSATGYNCNRVNFGYLFCFGVQIHYGCVTTRSATIVDVPQVGLGTFTAVQTNLFFCGWLINNTNYRWNCTLLLFCINR
jgi:hypothetical protein